MWKEFSEWERCCLGHLWICKRLLIRLTDILYDIRMCENGRKLLKTVKLLRSQYQAEGGGFFIC